MIRLPAVHHPPTPAVRTATGAVLEGARDDARELGGTVAAALTG